MKFTHFKSFSYLQKIDSQFLISMNRNRRQGSSIPSLLDMPGSGSSGGGGGSFGSSYGNNYSSSSSTGFGLSSGRWHYGVFVVFVVVSNGITVMFL